jgi:TonB family protein
MAECPDCDNIVILAMPERGNGECSRCHGTGEIWEPSTTFTGEEVECFVCRGTAVCQTCSGSGQVADDDEPSRDRDEDDDRESEDDEDYSSGSSGGGSYGSGYGGSSASYSSGGSSYGSDSGSSPSSSTSEGNVGGLLGCALIGLVILGGIAMLLDSQRTRPAPTASVTRASVAAVKLNLRAGPGMNYAIVDHLVNGDVVDCLERRDGTNGTIWVRVRAGSREGWVTEKYLTSSVDSAASDSSPKDDPTTQSPAGSVRVAGGRLSFFESGYDPPARDSRAFSARFAKSTARYINWQASLEFAESAQHATAPLSAVFYKSTGAVFARQSITVELGSGSTSTVANLGYGWREAGNWQPGRYRVELFAGSRRIATGSFEVYDDRPVEQAEPTEQEATPPIDPPSYSPRLDDPTPPRLSRRATQRVSGGVLVGKAIRKPQPSYPQFARTAGVEGSVVVEVTVDERGYVVDARALSGHALLRDAAVDAARRWVLTPT